MMADNRGEARGGALTDFGANFGHKGKEGAGARAKRGRKDHSFHVCFKCGIPWEAFGSNVAAGVIRLCEKCRKPNGDKTKEEHYVRTEPLNDTAPAPPGPCASTPDDEPLVWLE